MEARRTAEETTTSTRPPQDAAGNARPGPRPDPTASGVTPRPRALDRASGGRLTDLVDEIRSYHPEADTALIHRAFCFAAERHEGQYRKSGEPYVSHPMSVARVIAEMRLDTASVCAALLHDVVEDTDATDADIRERFGEDVAFLVDGVTKLGRFNFTSKEDQQAESFRKMLLAMARDIRVVLVKLADRLDNMRTLQHMKPSSQARIAQETLDVYAPLAGRLGIQWMKSELEDLTFRYLHPEPFQDLQRKIKRAARDSERYIVDVQRKLQTMFIERGFSVEVTGRVKHLYSIWRKMCRNRIEFDQVQDFIAFRVLTETVADCYACLGVVHSQWTPIPGRFKDYIALPKPNMYQSLHTSVIGPGRRRIEVQIRTHEMHRTAEHGIAAHWSYKETKGGIDPKEAARFAWLRQLVEFQNDLPSAEEFMESVKGDLIPDEVYVFTPAGDVKNLPRGATPLDFAYGIHSEVGEHCAGARVNGAIVPLRTTLKNGDTVEILTQRDQSPNKDWLDFVVTSKARQRIRSHLHSEERRRSIKLGRDLVERELHKRGLSPAKVLKSASFEAAQKATKAASSEDVFAKVGYGKVSAGQVVDAVAPPEQEADRDLRPSFLERTVHRVTRRTDKPGIVIDGVDGVLVRYAKCCMPVPGDPVVGWISRGRGVTVHRRGCSKALELDPERRIDVTWAGKDPNLRLPVSMRVVSADRPGILAHVSQAFTDAGVNIDEANCRTLKDGRALNLFHFQVSDVGRVQTLTRFLERIEGVYQVERV